MRRVAVLLCLAVALAAVPPALAQHGAEAAPGGHSSHGPGSASHGGVSDIWWKWANFAILAGALGYLIRKKAPAFFDSRDREIRSGIEEASRLRAEAEAHAASIENRLANLSAEIEGIRRAAREEMSAEGERLREETAQLLAKVRDLSRREIEGSAKAARGELKAYAADLALRLAEQRIRGRLTPATDEALVRAFVDDLRGQSVAPRGEVH